MKIQKISSLLSSEREIESTWDIFSGRTSHGLKRLPSIRLIVKLVFANTILAFAVIPVLWVLSAAFDTSNSINNATLLPRNLSMKNFQLLLSNPDAPFLKWVTNSIVISVSTTIIVCTLSAFSAYSFSRFRYRGQRFFSTTILIFQLFPNILAIVALYLILSSIGEIIPFFGLNSLGGLILIYSSAGLGFNMWIMKGYFDTIPMELDEAARIDGASNIQIFFQIFLPLAKPVIYTVGMLTFIGTYGDFFLPRVMLNNSDNFTLAIGLTKLVVGQYTTQWGIFAAGALLGCIPVVIIFGLLQKNIVSGATLGAVKF